jgi:hypothetical protein
MAARLVVACVGLLMSLHVAVPAEPEAESTGSASLGLGVRYDSNLAVLDLDAASDTGDTAAVLELGLAWQWRGSGGTGIRAGYDLSEARQSEISEFDLRTQRLSLDAGSPLGETDIGVLLNHTHAALDGDRFLTLQQASPYVSRLFSERMLLRLAYAWTDKDFAAHPRRDARTQTVSGLALVFFDGTRSYLVLGAHHDDERAQAQELAYTGHRLATHWVRRAQVGARELRARTGLRYERRRYAAPDLMIDMRRSDERFRFEAQVDVPLWRQLRAELSYGYADNRSNVPAVDFSEHTVAAMLRAGF